ncbi:hypothetical protein [Piscirickettsia litoralis]|uniref:Uncharacterized protein n=1 Tax=Piscirickettsia litoralis TaxID=1891921 RepID=A0ABX3A703_9GAMM|nr:hypothetical protein [Piscirickettsia litoralis]ODN43295.1 hypothetical protein BGC07_10640 [Piscirickettsia litoralis]
MAQLSLLDQYSVPSCKKDLCFWGVVPVKSGFLEKINTPAVSGDLSIQWLVEGKSLLTKKSSSIIDVAAIFTIKNKSFEKLRKDFEYISRFEFLEMASNPV